MPARLDKASRLGHGVCKPGWPREGTGLGIVHIGVGAFHRAHQAVYTDDALGLKGGDWMITGVSLRSAGIARALNPQDGLYTVLTTGAGGVKARVVGSIGRVLVAPEDPRSVCEALAAPATRIVSLTITEKGYGIDSATGGLDREHPDIAADLADPENPRSAIGFIVEALRIRRQNGLPGFTVLCCDNLPANGKLVSRLVLSFARERAPDLADWIAAQVRFPSTMVDRITPAPTASTLAKARALIGAADHAAVETEPFSQWIIEDDFVGGRPSWECGGAIMVDDVAPYEKMKLTLLNGSHSLLAYAGYLAGHRLVRDVMGDYALSALVRRHMLEAQRTLDAVPGIDLDAYVDQLCERFANPSIAHETYQIAMDGTQKLPQRLIAPAAIALQAGLPLDTYGFAVAAWMRYALGIDDQGRSYVLRDPRQHEIEAQLLGTGRRAGAIVSALMDLPGLFPDSLRFAPQWRDGVLQRLEIMLARGMKAAIAAEAG